jgi:hypothetical protein
VKQLSHRDFGQLDAKKQMGEALTVLYIIKAGGALGAKSWS